MTEEERRLWYCYLRELPIHFYRQKVTGRYILDFYCPRAKLAIELDGSQHYTEEGEASDKERDEYLKQQGITVLRYSNLDIQQRFNNVCEDIDRYLKL